MVYAIVQRNIVPVRVCAGSENFIGEPTEAGRKCHSTTSCGYFRIAMQEANAYYDPLLRALLFGYFPASETDPGNNLPGQTIFTCLSHDIVAHETTHATD